MTQIAYSHDLPIKAIAEAPSFAEALELVKGVEYHFLAVTALVARPDCDIDEASKLLEESEFNGKILKSFLEGPAFSKLSFKEASAYAEKFDYRDEIVMAVLSPDRTEHVSKKDLVAFGKKADKEFLVEEILAQR